MTDKQNKRNLDPERMDQHDEKESTDKDFNAGGNASDYDGGHPKDSDPKSGGRINNGEEYARRQHGKDEIEERSFNAGGNASDYDGGHPEDSSSDSEGHIDSDKNKN
ncbi:hypothetical protein BB776_05100 [Planococcus salinarum]|uniref:Glucose starvation-inducible protein B n=1 Tax=Planococcus salinarum TaxID=622695 RepID=A0ABX3D267_9BACL|nr:hypothetical protein [Planococcus salinarum]OHX56379.1 hypothetical protein BB776_05100 [Planococcus salinarum]TAA73549.1 hypothetical protein D2909_01520 [Planococcus salinarum]